MSKSHVLWFTGLSGSGKTTIVNMLRDTLVRKGRSVIVLDGDEIRNTINKNLGFTPEEIKQNNESIARLAASYKNRYDYILVAVISPFIECRRKAREIINEKFSEIYIKASLKKVINKDTKGLYAKAIRGEIDNFIGISPNTPYEEPNCPDIALNTDELDVASTVKKLYHHLKLQDDQLS